jgi:hypothetical protein
MGAVDSTKAPASQPKGLEVVAIAAVATSFAVTTAGI